MIMKLSAGSSLEKTMSTQAESVYAHFGHLGKGVWHCVILPAIRFHYPYEIWWKEQYVKGIKNTKIMI